MCWMSLFRGGDDAARRALEACREAEKQSGGHSWGLAAAVDGDLVMVHGLGNIPDDIVGLLDGVPVDAALGHTRLATAGDVTIDNAHPFAVRDDDGEVIAALAHNGTWHGAPRDPFGDEHSDSYYIARVLERALNEHDIGMEAAVKVTGQFTGETITVLAADGSGYAYSGRYGITEVADGMASTGGADIPDGRIVTL